MITITRELLWKRPENEEKVLTNGTLNNKMHSTNILTLEILRTTRTYYVNFPNRKNITNFLENQLEALGVFPKSLGLKLRILSKRWLKTVFSYLSTHVYGQTLIFFFPKMELNTKTLPQARKSTCVSSSAKV